MVKKNIKDLLNILEEIFYLPYIQIYADGSGNISYSDGETNTRLIVFNNPKQMNEKLTVFYKEYIEDKPITWKL